MPRLASSRQLTSHYTPSRVLTWQVSRALLASLAERPRSTNLPPAWRSWQFRLLEVRHAALRHLLSYAYLTRAHLASPELTSPHLASPRLTSPHLALTSPHLASPRLTSPCLSLPLLAHRRAAQHRCMASAWMQSSACASGGACAHCVGWHLGSTHSGVWALIGSGG